MATTLKEVASFPENAIAWAIDQLPEERREGFLQTLKELKPRLGEKPKKESKKSLALPSDKELFEDVIFPQIKRKLSEIEMMEEQLRAPVVRTTFSFQTDLAILSMGELANNHNKIVKLENSIQIFDNILKFYRGLIYHAVQQKSPNGIHKWMEQFKITVSVSTVYRYMMYTSTIARFPRLILCDLNFSQILKHKNRLVKELGKTENAGLRDRLSDSVEIKLDSCRVKINYQESQISASNMKTYGADWIAIDSYVQTEAEIEILPDIKSAIEITDTSVQELEAEMNELTKM